MTTADKDKIRSGKYSLWSFQNFFHFGTTTGNKKRVLDYLTDRNNYTEASTSLGSGGVSISSMQVKRAAAAPGSTSDGGIITP
jgi:hypothetical protein